MPTVHVVSEITGCRDVFDVKSIIGQDVDYRRGFQRVIAQLVKLEDASEVEICSTDERFINHIKLMKEHLQDLGVSVQLAGCSCINHSSS
jgi:hypothetical protein